jgi:hypothetical protein
MSAEYEREADAGPIGGLIATLLALILLLLV